jgi:hypothetical protein
MNADRMSRIGAVAVVVAAVAVGLPAWADEEKPATGVLGTSVDPATALRAGAAAIGAVAGGLATSTFLSGDMMAITLGTAMGAGVGYMASEPPPVTPDGEPAGITASTVVRAGAILGGAAIGGMGAGMLFPTEPLKILIGVGMGGAGAYMLTAPAKAPVLAMPPGSAVRNPPSSPPPEAYRKPVTAEGYRPFGSY